VCDEREVNEPEYEHPDMVRAGGVGAVEPLEATLQDDEIDAHCDSEKGLESSS
jgi:hypothetical protein